LHPFAHTPSRALALQGQGLDRCVERRAAAETPDDQESDSV